MKRISLKLTIFIFIAIALFTVCLNGVLAAQEPPLKDILITHGTIYNDNDAEAMRPVIVGTEGVVATGNVQASLVGYDIIKKGGNAFDAGVAAAMALKVTKMDLAGWCGITPFIGYSAKEDKVAAYAGVGKSPMAATAEFFTDQGDLVIPTGADDRPFQTALVPTEPDTFVAILQRWGTMSFTECIQGALELCERGFPAHHYHAAGVWRSYPMDTDTVLPYNKEYWFQYGRQPKVGELIANKDLGKTFRIMINAEQEALANGWGRNAALEAARDAFYKGEIAKATVRFYQQNGGIITYDDLANYHGKWYEPLKTTYKGIEIYTTPTWTQGLLMIQYFNMLENYDLHELGYNTPEYIHLLSQIINLGMADRHRYFSDPDMVDIPEGLWSKEYAKERIKLIDMDKAFPEAPPAGDPQKMKAILETKNTQNMLAMATPEDSVNDDTTYLCVIDGEGNIFSMTPSDGHVVSPMVPGYGFGLSRRMKQFTLLDPSLASYMEPGKRPMVTPNPMLALKDGKPFLAIGTPGGDQQTQSMLQVLLNYLEWGMNPQLALDQPRFGSYNLIGAFSPHPYYPGRLALEGSFPEELGEALELLGHKVTWKKAWSICSPCFVVKDPESGLIKGGADVRRESYAVGW